MPNPTDGLYPKYRVTDPRTGEEVPGVFPLRPATDAAARAVMRQYLSHPLVRGTQLASDLQDWLASLEQPPPGPGQLLECRAPGCGATLKFVPMETGGHMPVEVVPSDTGTIAVNSDGVGRVVGKGGEGADIPLDARYETHFATCTDPDRFRRHHRR